MKKTKKKKKKRYIYTAILIRDFVKGTCFYLKDQDILHLGSRCYTFTFYTFSINCFLSEREQVDVELKCDPVPVS